jgi:hypothetical protein
VAAGPDDASDVTPYASTTCGRDAYRRRSHQKVVAFSFYGDVHSKESVEKGYFEGILENLKLMAKHYPGEKTLLLFIY